MPCGKLVILLGSVWLQMVFKPGFSLLLTTFSMGKYWVLWLLRKWHFSFFCFLYSEDSGAGRVKVLQTRRMTERTGPVSTRLGPVTVRCLRVESQIPSVVLSAKCENSLMRKLRWVWATRGAQFRGPALLNSCLESWAYTAPTSVASKWARKHCSLVAPSCDLVFFSGVTGQLCVWTRNSCDSVHKSCTTSNQTKCQHAARR